MRSRGHGIALWKYIMTGIVVISLVGGTSAVVLAETGCQWLADKEGALYHERIEVEADVGYYKVYLSHCIYALNRAKNDCATAASNLIVAEAAYESALDKIAKIKRLACWGLISCIVSAIRYADARKKANTLLDALLIADEEYKNAFGWLLEKQDNHDEVLAALQAALMRLRQIDDEISEVQADFEACIADPEDEPDPEDWPDLPPRF